jgi:exopolyphosphatase/pppGpp-phosphohydrolase
MIVNTISEPKGKKERRCCIDLGSSYFRLLSVDVESGPRGRGAVDPVEERIYIGWGEDVAASGLITEARAAMAADILGRLLRTAFDTDCARTTIVSTGTLRAASNGEEARKYLEERTGREINVLSEREEAFLGFLGATFDFPEGKPVVLVDPGGTSTEISWGLAPQAKSFVSIGLGTHSARGGWRRIAAAAGEMLVGEGVPRCDSPLPGSEESPTIMFTGGTAVSIASVWKSMHGERFDCSRPVRISAAELDLVSRRIAGLLRSGLWRKLPLARERIGLLPQGLAITAGAVRAMRAGRIAITTRDLRWGAVLGEKITDL